MKHTTIDRFFVIWIVSALVVWVCALGGLWAWAFDSSGGSALITLAAGMFAIAVAARLSLPLAGVAGRLFSSSIKFTLGGSVVGAVAGGLIGSVAVYGGAIVAVLLARYMLWTPLGWTAVKLAVQFVAMIPPSLGLCSVIYAFSLVRAKPGHDPYSELFGDLLWATAGGIGAFGALWCSGVNLLGLVMLIAMMLMVAVMIMSQRSDVRRSSNVTAEDEKKSSSRFSGFGTMLTFALLAFVGLVQWRMIIEITKLDSAGGVCFVALSIGLVAWFFHRLSRKEYQPSGLGECGCVAVLVSTAGIQGALAITYLHGGVQGMVCGISALACQVPIMAIAAIMIFRSRRRGAQFAAAKHGMAYVSYAAGGAGLAVVISLVVASVPACDWVLMAMTASICAAAVLAGGIGKGRSERRWIWLACGVILTAATVMIMFMSLHQTQANVGRIKPGFWISTTEEKETELDSWRSRKITDAITTIMQDTDEPDSRYNHTGRWWIVRGSRLDLPELPRRIYGITSVIDAAAAAPGIWRDGSVLIPGSERDFFQAGHIGRELYDAAFLSPLSADHNRAWRCYNYQTLLRCRMRVHNGGVILLRTTVRLDKLSAAISIARTFHRVMGNSWAIMELNHNSMDMLLVGPAVAIDADSWRREKSLTVVSTEKFWNEWPEVAPMDMIDLPPSPLLTPITPGRFNYWLKCSDER